MSVRRPCPACSVGDCHLCRPQDPPRDEDGKVNGQIFLGGTVCSCGHTEEEREEREREARKAYERFFIGGDRW